MKKIILIAGIAISILFASCSNNSTEEDGHGEEEAGHDEHSNSNTVTLTKEQEKSLELELGIIEKKQLTSSLKANGLLKVPNQNKANVTALTGGVIKSINVQTGNTVKRGQVVATIANNSFIILQEDFITVSAEEELAQLELIRQKELQEGNAGALKNLQAIESKLKVLKARKESLRKQLELIGINTKTLTSENIHSVISIVSPINGTISNVMVNIGSYVDATNPIAEIVDNNQLHLDLFVYEKDLQKIQEGQTIHFTLTNNPGKEYDADVYAISNTFEQNKAIAVHAMVKGDKVGLIDGMSITALISLENATVDAVPTDAIVSHEGQDYIFIVTDAHKEEEHHEEGDKEEHDEHGHKHGESEKQVSEHEGEEGTTFEKIPVRKGTTDIGYSEITLLKEIPANSKIVTNGAFFILAKMNNKGEAHSH
jgi:cobalt-zinc-cadmium efflux system membrane fusion protein